jgi:hypothetical protein
MKPIMSMPDNNTFKNLISDKLKDHEFNYSDAAWKKMQQKLEKEEKPVFASSFNKILKIFSIAVLLISVSFFTGYQFIKTAHQAGNLQNNRKSNQDISPTEGAKQFKSDPYKMDERTVTDHLPNDFVADNNPLKVLYKHKLIQHKTDLVSGNGDISDPVLPMPGNDIGSQPHLKIVGIISTITDSDSSKIRIVSGISSTKPLIPEKSAPGPKNKTANEFTKRTISFGPFIGYNATAGRYHGANYLDITPGCIGAFINIPLSEKISIQSGLTYNLNVPKWIVRSDTSLVMNDARGKVYRVTETTTEGLAYFQLPLLIKYKLNDHFRVMGGIQFSWLNGISSVGYKNDFQKDSLGHYKLLGPSDSLAYFNYNTDIRKLSIEMPLGLQWNISRSFDLSLIYYLGLNNVLKTNYHYIETQGNSNSLLQIRLGYKLFSKKYHEE